jgi:sigma-B regulation protein RsbU (phosphoserine phosphatase)
MIYSLRTKILAIGLAFFALLGAAFVLYSMATTVHYKRLRLEGIRKTVEFETEKVNKIIMGMEQGAEILALDGLISHWLQSYDINETMVIGYLNGFEEAVGGGFWFEPYADNKNRFRSNFYAFFDKSVGRIRFDDTFNTDEYDYHSKSWYREIFDEVTRPYQVVWTKPYVDDSGSFSLMTTAGAGIFTQDGLIGISTIDWEINKVIKELTAIKPTKNSFVLLCVPEQDYIISGTRDSITAGASIKSLSWDINADSFTLDDIQYLRFGRYMDNGWLLSVQIPKTEIFTEVEEQNNRFSLLIALAAAAMMGIAYFLISKFINAPIKRLTQDVSQLALGNLDATVEIDSNDELGLLAKAFNKMTGDLKKSIEENVRERAEKERIGAELGVAAAIQASMLPNIFPPFPERTEFDLYASMLPAKEVGGDFYDFYLIDKDNLAVVIADVSGKGVPAALFMMITKTMLKDSSPGKCLKDIFESVNNKLCEGNKADMFVTAFMGIYNIPDRKFAFVNAGHNPPLIKKHGGGYEFLETEPGYVLAWMKNAKYTEKKISLEPGEVLFLYTDGITEAMNQRKELFGEQRLLAALNANGDSPLKDLLPIVKQEVDNFADGTEQADDITMLVLKINDGAEYSGIAPEESMKMLKIKASLENLNKALDFINTELEQRGCPEDIQGKIEVAVEEVFVNIANYAYSPDSGDAVIYITVNDEAVIRFEDTGRPYNPLEKPEPDLDKPLMERDIGGLGVFLVKKLMDNVEYERVGNRNVLVMTKTVSSEQ